MWLGLSKQPFPTKAAFKAQSNRNPFEEGPIVPVGQTSPTGTIPAPFRRAGSGPPHPQP